MKPTSLADESQVSFYHDKLRTKHPTEFNNKQYFNIHIHIYISLSSSATCSNSGMSLWGVLEREGKSIQNFTLQKKRIVSGGMMPSAHNGNG